MFELLISYIAIYMFFSRLKAGGLGAGGPQENSILVQNLVNGLSLEFECSEPLKRLRLLLSEIIYVMAQVSITCSLYNLGM